MKKKVVKLTGPSHPITIKSHPGLVTVTFAGQLVARSANALVVSEFEKTDAFYLPRHDVDMRFLQPTDVTIYNPYTGLSELFALVANGRISNDTAWTYAVPLAVLDQVRGWIAFDASLVDDASRHS